MKRFTETEKWTKDKWFCELEPRYKLFWLYICDQCDNVGVWEENLRIANFSIGIEYPLDTLLEVFEGRIHVFDNGNKWWVRGFVEFQHPDMSEESTSKAVRSYISLLKKHGLWKEYAKGIDTLQGKGKGKGKGEGTGKKPVSYTTEFEEWWGAFGRKGSKPNAFKAWKAATIPEDIISLTEKYLAHCKAVDRTQKDGQGWINGEMWASDWSISGPKGSTRIDIY